MQRLLERVWYGGHWLARLLYPLSLAFRMLVWLRRMLYARALLECRRLPVPVLVVGNIAVGGTGKTPLVIWVAGHLRRSGLKPGVVCRGYRAGARSWPQRVRCDSDPSLVGDEAVVIARRTGCPVIADPDRVRGALALVEDERCDTVVSDDGLQHYRLGRDIEVAVVDGRRRHGNGLCLPAGPLREPPARLASVDLVVANGPGRDGEFPMRLAAGPVISLADATRRRQLSEFAETEVDAVCGIGHPDRFFAMLRAAGVRARCHAFEDHHAFRAEDLRFETRRPILMTEKDAVKCERLGLEDAWFVRVDAELPGAFAAQLDRLLADARVRAVAP